MLFSTAPPFSRLCLQSPIILVVMFQNTKWVGDAIHLWRHWIHCGKCYGVAAETFFTHTQLALHSVMQHTYNVCMATYIQHVATYIQHVTTYIQHVATYIHVQGIEVLTIHSVECYTKWICATTTSTTTTVQYFLH